jgi:Putative Flp pilus-assembly TadE/G-like
MSLPKMHLHVGEGLDPVEIGVKEAGQIIVIFALMLTVLIGLVGIAIDVTYAWRNGLQVQRAADAAALAGVVYMPGSLGNATTRADAIATSNGYTTGGGTTVTVAPNPTNTRQLDVTITVPVQTFFVRLFGINTWTVTRMARAAYIMPVPMGSPLAYMGVGCFVLQTGNQATLPGCKTTGNGDSGLTASGLGNGGLQSLGAWGAISAPGGDEQNGDAYAPENNSTGSPSNNVMYPASPTGANGYKGYFYTVALPAGGSIKIFDPGFCAMGSATAGNYGAGDHWVGSAGSSYPVSTYYTLWTTNDQPINPGAWTPYGISSSYENQYGWDSANNNGNAAPTGATDCKSASWHDAWVSFASVPAGTYELQVSTTNPSGASEASDGTNAQNMFAIEAIGTGSPTVYGYDKMAVYNNLSANNVVQQFYIAKVDQETGAGKTLTIDFFDIGDSSAGTIQILSPDTAGSPVPINFNYTTFNYNASLGRVGPPGNCKAKSGSTVGSDSCTGTGVSSITVARLNGTTPISSFNNTWIEISIPLPTTYGSGGLWQGGWWQVQYNVSASSDLTTWSVNVNGNPVHLVPVTGP